jgi:drug/metabolite transporter (DMT)-like permease
VTVAALAFSTSGPLSRWARPTHPLVVAFGRVALAGAVLALVDVKGTVAALRALPRRAARLVGVAGVLLALHFALFLSGLDLTSLPAAIALVSLEPLSVVVFAWLLHGVAPRPLERVGVLVATVGAVVVGSGQGAGEHRLLGDLLVLGAVAVYGLYVGIARTCAEALPARVYAASVYGVAALALLPAVALTEGARRSPLPPHGLVAILALAAVPTLIGHTSVQTAARSLSPSTVALVSPGETLGGLAIGALLLGAVPTRLELVGAALVLLGAVVSIRGAAPQAP